MDHQRVLYQVIFQDSEHGGVNQPLGVPSIPFHTSLPFPLSFLTLSLPSCLAFRPLLPLSVDLCKPGGYVAWCWHPQRRCLLLSVWGGAHQGGGVDKHPPKGGCKNHCIIHNERCTGMFQGWRKRQDQVDQQQTGGAWSTKTCKIGLCSVRVK